MRKASDKLTIVEKMVAFIKKGCDIRPPFRYSLEVMEMRISSVGDVEKWLRLARKLYEFDEDMVKASMV